ncbi:hypothetical protein GGR56DRAFT_334682 [Xylariaceae sp. FL0804]|nr:hypothetical protein GGR56DRAFT_334682 [Xylariaceae sp. FL0804]
MEAIGAGANVAAFVVIGLQSAKICYNTLSAIKDGPVIVQQVANDVLQLDWILRDQSTARAAAQDTPLVGYIRICREQLDEMAAAIGKFQTTPDERKAGKLWKRFKSFLGEKRLEIIGANISRQVGFLGLRIENVNLTATSKWPKRSGMLVASYRNKQTHKSPTSAISVAV